MHMYMYALASRWLELAFLVEDTSKDLNSPSVHVSGYNRLPLTTSLFEFDDAPSMIAVEDFGRFNRMFFRLWSSTGRVRFYPYVVV